MSQINHLFLRAVRLDQMVSALLELAKAAFDNEQVGISITTNIADFELSAAGHAQSLRQDARVDDFLKRTAGRAHLVVVRAQLGLAHNGNISYEYASDDGIVARLEIHSQRNLDRTMRMLEAAEQHFALTSYLDLVRSTSPAVDQAAIAMRERSVADLQEAVRQIGVFQLELSKREAERREALEAASAEAHRARSDALEKEYRERQADLDRAKQAAEDESRKRETEHRDRVASFETRESKYMRRELLKEIRAVLADAEKTALSKPTARKRWWVHSAVWIMLVASASMATVMAYKVFGSAQADWHVFVPLSASFLTFVCTMIYYFKWNDRWFREHADSEFAAKRYKADILRASWIAELAQEWVKEAKGELPPELLAAYTRNLFRDVGTSRVSEHPMDDLTSIVKRATEIEVGKTGFAIRGVKATAKAEPE